MMYRNGHMSTAGRILSLAWTLIIVARRHLSPPDYLPAYRKTGALEGTKIRETALTPSWKANYRDRC